jgi:threonyl-tRNA synthetase
MREIMAEDQPFVRHEHSLEEGLALFADQPFKREIIEAVGAGPTRWTPAEGAAVVSHLLELAGLHRPVPGAPRPLDQPAGPLQADAGGRRLLARRREAAQLQRIYGTAWESEKALAAHLHQLEEAERATTASSAPSSTSSASPRRSARVWPSSTPRAGRSAG